MAAQLGIVAGSAAQRAATSEMAKYNADPAGYISTVCQRLGLGLLIGGLALAVVSWAAQQGGTRLAVKGRQEVANYMQTVTQSTLTPPQPVGWNWNPMQDLTDVYDVVTGAADAVVNTAVDIGKSVLFFPMLMGGSLTLMGGETVVGIGWIGEQIFPYLVVFGAALLAIGILIRIGRDAWAEFVAPRFAIWKKALIRRAVQRPLDARFLTPSVMADAQAYNDEQAFVTGLANGTAAPPPIAEITVEQPPEPPAPEIAESVPETPPPPPTTDDIDTLPPDDAARVREDIARFETTDAYTTLPDDLKEAARNAEYAMLIDRAQIAVRNGQTNGG